MTELIPSFTSVAASEPSIAPKLRKVLDLWHRNELLPASAMAEGRARVTDLLKAAAAVPAHPS